jgi:hypothetical protein
MSEANPSIPDLSVGRRALPDRDSRADRPRIVISTYLPPPVLTDSKRVLEIEFGAEETSARSLHVLNHSTGLAQQGQQPPAAFDGCAGK